MEGTAAVCSWSQVDPSNVHEYPIYRRNMTREVRAAIDGAREGGAGDFLINDSHWDMRNLVWDELPSGVRLITGNRKPFSMVQGAEQRCDAAFFTGYHARVGEADATLAHTYSSDTLYDVRVNGTPCTEALLNAAVLGHYGTPVVLVTGDRATVDSVSRSLPWITGVVVKDSIGYYSVNSLTPAAACEAIREGARDALRSLEHAKPFSFEAPIELVVETAKTEQADVMELLPAVSRIGARAVSFHHDDYLTVFRMFLAITRIGAAASLPA
jgi:D-amino peptidase